MSSRIAWMALVALACGGPTDGDVGDVPRDDPQVDASLVVSDVDFGEQRMGQEASPREVFVTNTGSVPLDIIDITAPDEQAGFFLGSSLAGRRLAPDTEASFQVRWLPNRLGSSTGGIFITTNATPGDATVVSATGTAISGALTSEPERIELVGTSDRVPIVLTNTGHDTLFVTGFELAGDAGLSVDLDYARNGDLPLELPPVDPATGLPSRTVFVEWDESVSDGKRQGVLIIDNDGYRTRVRELPIVISN